VAALRTALDREPDTVVGKPEPALFVTAAHRTGASRPLVVGDRLDTDIEGAGRAGMDSLLVLTGVNNAADLLAAPPQHRPTYVAFDLTGLFDAAGAVRVPAKEPAGAAPDGGWRVTDDGAGPRLTGSGRPLEALQALCGWAWSGHAINGLGADSEPARAALRDLGLSD
jgi:hypothetical protein